MRRPTFSILILTCTALDRVRRCFDSLRYTLTREDVECRVLDAGCGPEVRRYLQHEPGITRLVRWPQDRGVEAGRDWLLRQARGELLVFLDCAAWVEDSLWLDRLAMALRPARVGLVGLSGAFVRWTESGCGLACEPAPSGPCDVVADGCFALRRSLRAAGVSFEAPAEGCGEARHAAHTPYGLRGGLADFCMQVRQAGYEVVCTERVGVRYLPGPAAPIQAPGCQAATCQQSCFRARWAGRGLIRAEHGYE